MATQTHHSFCAIHNLRVPSLFPFAGMLSRPTRRCKLWHLFLETYPWGWQSTTRCPATGSPVATTGNFFTAPTMSGHTKCGSTGFSRLSVIGELE
jgi:hypothetical protein